MKKIISTLFVLLIGLQAGFSQDPISIRPGPDEGKDARIWTNYPDENFGSIPKFVAMGWTFSGEQGVERSLIDFDLSVIPPDQDINQALLYLYFYSSEPSGLGHSGENAAWLKLVTSPWEEDSVTWNNMPSTTVEPQVYVPQSTDPEQDYIIDVTSLVTAMVEHPDMYHGMMLQLIDEEPYRSLMFASSDNEDPDLRPMLVITFCDPPECSFDVIFEDDIYYFYGYSSSAYSWWWDFGDGYFSDLQNPVHQYWDYGTYNVCLTVEDSCGTSTFCDTISYMPPTGGVIVIQPGAEGKDALLQTTNSNNNYGSSEKFKIMAWTFWGDPGVQREIIEFDLSDIPEGSEILDASLDMYFYSNEITYVPHTGDNTLLIRTVLESWEEDQVTWNNQPGTSAINQVVVPPSVYPEQDYTDLDVTALVQHQFQYPDLAHGFMFQLETEFYYRSVMLASSDNADPAKHPRLTITYGPPLPSYFSYEPDGLTVSFYNNCPEAVSWSWDFGDGTTSTLQNPVHEYENTGDYEVCLTVYDGYESFTSCLMIYLGTTGLVDQAMQEVNVYPNPATDRLEVVFPQSGTYEVALLNTMGQTLLTQDLNGDHCMFNVSGLSNGLYLLTLKSGRQQVIRKLIIQH